MKLGAWIKRENLTLDEVGRRIGKHLSSVQKYVLGRVPGKTTMVRIYRETKGEVTPNDFFDLPDLGADQGPDLEGEPPIDDVAKATELEAA